MNIWDALLITPLTTALFFFYNLLGGNLGLAIIALTVALRLLLFPLTLPSLKSMKIQREIKPDLDRIQKKYKGDRQKLATAQMELFKQRGVNPLAGCLPQILQLVILIALYQVFISNLQNGGLNHQFLFWDLSVKDPYFVFPVLAAASQFILSKMMLPAVSQEHKAAHEAKDKKEDFASALQRQNLFLFPILTLFLGLQFPAGLMLYWFVSTVLQIPQQLFVLRSKS
ncbi:MAG: YidC/Oxa1 family membrane protein insertase [Patescibacteria group bacterium]